MAGMKVDGLQQPGREIRLYDMLIAPNQHEARQMRKTIDIDDDLKALIDKLRKEHNTSMKVIVNDALRRGLEIEENRERDVHNAE
jgi:hypothetical protein